MEKQLFEVSYVIRAYKNGSFIYAKPRFASAFGPLGAKTCARAEAARYTDHRSAGELLYEANRVCPDFCWKVVCVKAYRKAKLQQPKQLPVESFWGTAS